MSGPKRNPDKLNTIGIVVVGICGAVLVYVTIVALQAFYMNDSSEVQTMADYGGQDKTALGHKADEMRNITEYASNSGGATFRIDIEQAIKLVAQDAQRDPSHLVPALPASTKPTIEPTFGRPKAAAPAGAAPAGAAAGSAAGSAAPAGAAAGSAAPAGAAAGSAAAAGSGAAAGSAATPSPVAPMTPTGGGSGH